LQIFEILENLGGVEDLQLSMDQNRHLPLGIDPRDFRMLRLVESLHIEGDHDALDIKPFLESCNLGLGAEHTQRARIKPHAVLARRHVAIILCAFHSGDTSYREIPLARRSQPDVLQLAMTNAPASHKKSKSPLGGLTV